MDSIRLQKLQEYAVFLTRQAESDELKGNVNQAVKDYVKLVDIILLLANETKDHVAWQRLIDRAEFFQKKANTLLSPQGVSKSKSSQFNEVRQASRTQEREIQDSSSVLKTLLKIPSLISRHPRDRGEEEPQSHEITDSSSFQELDFQSQTTPYSLDDLFPVPEQRKVNDNSEENIDPYTSRVYLKLLQEKSLLEEQVEVLRNKEKEYLARIEAKEKQLAQRKEPPKESVNEVIRTRLVETVSRSEYEQAITIIRRYIELQMQLAEVEAKLQSSVPRAIIDEIAEYVSFLVSTATSADDRPEVGTGNTTDKQT